MTSSIDAVKPGPGTPVEPSWTFGDRLRKARSVAQMDQRQFADALGVSIGSLPGWETDRQKPRDIVAVARKVEEVTGISAAWMLGLGKVTAG